MIESSSDHRRLLALLKELSYRKGEFTLSSGKKSDFYINCKTTMLTAEGHALAGTALFEVLHVMPTWPTAVAGVELGGCPLASAVSLISYQKGRPLNALYVRKVTKEHGTVQRVEGKYSRGESVVLLEDVVTTGASTLRAIESLEGAGLAVGGVIALVDREEGAKDVLQHRTHFTSLFTRSDFVNKGTLK